jgi:hypothetical protein
MRLVLARHHVQLRISFRGIGFFFMEDCAPFIFIRNWCCNSSFGLMTKARVCKRVRAESEAWESHFMLLGVQESVREWTATSQVSSHFESWNPNGLLKIQRSKLTELKNYLYHWKAFKNYMFKMNSHDPFGNLKHKLWPKKRSGVKLVVWLPTIKSQELPWFPYV